MGEDTGMRAMNFGEEGSDTVRKLDFTTKRAILIDGEGVEI